MNVILDNNLTIDEYNYLRESVNWNRINDKQVKKSLVNSMYLVKAIVDGKTVGMARLVGDKGYISFIVDVIVEPLYQRKGIGRMMINNILEYVNAYLNENDVMMISLLASKGNTEFYKKLGFQCPPDNLIDTGLYKWIGLNKK